MELVREKNVATIITFPLKDANGDNVTGATSLDTELDTWSNGSAPNGFTDCTNEATEIGSTGQYYLSLTQSEMNNDYIILQVKSGNAKTQTILINTVHYTAIAGIKTKTDQLTFTTANKIDARMDYAGSTAISTSADVKADVSGLGTTTQLNTIEGKVDIIDGNVDLILVDTSTTIPAQITSVHGATDTLIADVPTVSEFNARTKLTADYFDPTTDEVDLGSIKGTALSESTSGNLASNLSFFYDLNVTTTKTVNDVGVAGAGLTAADVWSYGTRTLTSAGSGGATAQEVWEYANRELTDKAGFTIAGTKTTFDSLNDITAADVWAAVTRTLTAGTKDTEIDSIKAKTDSLTFTTAGKIDSRVDSIGSNSVTSPDDLKADVSLLATAASISNLNDITVAEIIAGVTEGALDLQEILRIILSAVAGKSSGGGTTTKIFRDQADTKNRIVATTDANNNRTSITVNGA